MIDARLGSKYASALFHSFQMYQLRFYKVFNLLTFICSKSTIETLEKGVKYVQS